MAISAAICRSREVRRSESVAGRSAMPWLLNRAGGAAQSGYIFLSGTDAPVKKRFASLASVSMIQRRLQIGYNRAASLIERMELEGIVGQANHAGKREILVEEEESGF